MLFLNKFDFKTPIKFKTIFIPAMPRSGNNLCPKIANYFKSSSIFSI